MVKSLMKAFTVFVVLSASAVADGVVFHESILWFHVFSSISIAVGVVSMKKRVWYGVFHGPSMEPVSGDLFERSFWAICSSFGVLTFTASSGWSIKKMS